MANFVSYSDAQQLMTKIGQKFSALTGAYIPKGSSAFAAIPATPTLNMVGYVYNITDDFTTDARFVEGAGKAYPAGSNVVIVDNSTFAAVTPLGTENPSSEGWYELDAVSGKYVLSTDTTVDGAKTYYAKTVLVQYDVIGGFVDLSEIENAIDDLALNFAGEFDETIAYSIGSVVLYENKLYMFTSAHTAGDPWDASEVTTTNVLAMINKSQYETISYVDNRITLIEAMTAPAFLSSNAYAAGSIVTYEDTLYKFTTAHTAGDPWSASEVTEVKVIGLINEVASTISNYANKVSIAPIFDASNAYAVGDLVYHEDNLYKFTSAHTAGDPWDATEVDSTTVSDLIEDAEPDSLTPQQISDLEKLLD